MSRPERIAMKNAARERAQGPSSEPFLSRVTRAFENYPSTTTAPTPLPAVTLQTPAVYRPSTATVAQGEFGPTPPDTPPPIEFPLPKDNSPSHSNSTYRPGSVKSDGDVELPVASTSSPPSSYPPPQPQPKRITPTRSLTQPPEMHRASTFSGPLTTSPVATSQSEPPSFTSPKTQLQGPTPSSSSTAPISKHLSHLDTPSDRPHTSDET